MVGAATFFECGACGAVVPMDERRCALCGTFVATTQGRTRGAPASRRSVAWFVDLLLLGVIMLVVMAIVGNVFPDDTATSGGGASGAIGALVVLLLPGAYFVPFDSRSGQSPGRRVARLRLAAIDGRDRLGFPCALRRAMWRYVAIVPCGIGYLWGLFGDRRTWHDIMSKTVVVPIDASIVVEEQTIPEPLRRARPLPAPVASAAQTFGVEVLDKPIDVASDAAEAFVAPSEQLTHERAAEFVRDLCGRGHYAQAAELLARDLHDHGSHPNDWCRVALLLVDGGRPADALNVVNSVLLGAPGFGPALAVKAHALLALGSPAHNQEALQLTESFPADRDPVMITASVCALALNDRVDEAQALLDTSRDLGSESVRASRLRFVIAVRTGNEAGALRWATAVADDEPFNALAQVRAAAPGSYGGFANLPRCGRSVRVVLRCTWRSLSQLDRTLPERAGRLLGAFDLAPQSQSAMRAVRRIGPTDPWYIVHNALATLLIVYGVNYAAFRLFSSVVALSVGIALAIIAIVRVGATVHASRGIPRELRAWRRYANDLSHTRYFRNFGRSPRHRQVRPPTNSVFGSAATCRCSKLNFLDGDSAVKYAWLHLAPRATSVETPTIKEFICPTTLVRWLGFQNTPSSPEVPQLCRLDSGLTDLYDDTTPTCA